MKIIKRFLIVIPVLIAILVVAVWALSYHSFEFKGGAGISDSGFFSYPRYHAQLGDIPLWMDSEYQFNVRGLPPGPLDFVLEVPGGTDTDRMALISLSTFVTVSIKNSSGEEICAATGTLSGASSGNHSTWVLATSSSSASFWHPRCQQLPISRFKSYIVKVKVSGADERSPHKMLKPTLQGGGNELP